jgi:two-component system OmpR family response regulator
MPPSSIGGVTIARIVVVDDNPEFRDLMDSLLPELGHECIVMDGTDASPETLAAAAPDLVIIDLRLERGNRMANGWRLILDARQHPALAATPIILVTGDARFLERHERDLPARPDEHGVRTLMKPFSVSDLETLIAEMLGNGNGNGEGRVA